MIRVNHKALKWEDSGNGYFRKLLMAAGNNTSKECRVQFVRIPPNTTVRPHYHKGQTEIEYVLSGSGMAVSGRQRMVLRSGTIFTVEPNDVHEVRAGREGMLLLVTKANYSKDTEWLE